MEKFDMKKIAIFAAIAIAIAVVIKALVG